MSVILTVPHPVLRQPAKPVENLDKTILDIIADMRTTLIAAKNPEGVGLAAPQIGIPLRIFLIRPLPDKTVTVFINPQIIKYSQRKQSPSSKTGVFEGCLSLPHHYAPLTRSLSVTVKYQTLTGAVQPGQSERPQRDRVRRSRNRESRTRVWSGEPQIVEKTATFSGFPAHIIQHELDHLNGILFIDRVLEQNTPLYKAEGDTWTEITL